MTITVDEYIFDFPAAKELYKFDQKDPISPYFHGADMMKSVDVMAEFAGYYLWIEIKNYTDDIIEKMKSEGDQRKDGDAYHAKSYLRNNLVQKYRDTFLYRYAEQKVDKPIFYVCLLNFDSALRVFFKREVAKSIPVHKPTTRWKRNIIDGFFVVNEVDWTRNASLSKIGTCRHV